MATSPKILIVDDNISNLEVLEAVIQNAIDAQPLLFDNGKAALESIPEHEIALAILDVNMPGMSGFELAEAIHRIEESRYMPIIFLSADFTDDHDISAGYTKGAVDYITKPFNSKILVSKIGVFMDLFEQRKRLEQEIAKRQIVETELRQIQAQLEDRVDERTRELSQTNDRLRSEIRERIKTAEKLSISEKKFRTMIESMQDMAFITDEDYRITYMNPAMIDQMGKKTVGKLCYHALHCGKKPCSFCAWESIEESRHIKYIFRNPQNDRYYHASSSIISRESGNSQKLTILRDITAEKETEKNLEYAKQKAEEANRSKSEFLANISHELRTPLHHVLAFARFGIDKTGTVEEKKVKRFFETIHESGENLLYLVNDLLDIAKLESGKLTFAMELVSLETVLNSSIEECVSSFEKKGVLLETAEIQGDTRLMCDKNRIKQVFQNLLTNAVKFTPAGKKVTVSTANGELPVTSADTPSSIPALLIRFYDEGIGIPENEMDTIFDKFIQSSKSRSEAGGTGLGLAICREIIKGHHGTLTVQSNPTEGTTFTVALPKPH